MYKHKYWLVADRKFLMFLSQEDWCMKECSANLAPLHQAVTYLPCFQVRNLFVIKGCNDWKVLGHNISSFFGVRGRGEDLESYPRFKRNCLQNRT